jgi:hypothetical protein
MKDEELQDSVEKGNVPEGIDARAYVRVFDALRKETSFQLPANFATRVVNRVDFSQQQSSDMLWLYLGLFSCLLAMVVAIAMTDFEFNFGAFRFIAGYPGLFVFALVFILGLQWIDKKMVRKPTV